MLSDIYYFLDIQTLLLFVAVFLGIYLYVSTWLPKNFPPGPPRLPMIGSLPVLGTDRDKVHITLTELSKKYGPLVGLKLGSYPAVLVNKLEFFKEVLISKGDKFRHRPHQMYCVSKFNKPGGKGQVRGLFWANGAQWKNSRRFALSSMRDFGMGKRSLEEKIQEEAVFLCAELMKVAGQPFDVQLLFQESVSNIICNICFGTRFDYTDPVFNKLMEMLRYNFQSDIFGIAANFIPLLRNLPENETMRNVMANAVALDKWIQSRIEKHRETFDPKQIRDFVDLYLSNENKDDVALCPENMNRIISDLFGAGSETTATGLRWALLFLILHPEIQKKCQEELDEVVGDSRQPSLSQRQEMPYMEGFIHETLRIGNVLVFNAPHSAECDTTLGGYSIPKDTIIMVNLYCCHMNSNYFPNPEEFTPERWIGPEGKFQKNEAFVPFALGPRVCPGETLARSELFLFLSFMLQRFTFRAEDPDNPPSLEGKIGITRSPKKFSVIVESR